MPKIIMSFAYVPDEHDPNDHLASGSRTYLRPTSHNDPIPRFEIVGGNLEQKRIEALNYINNRFEVLMEMERIPRVQTINGPDGPIFNIIDYPRTRTSYTSSSSVDSFTSTFPKNKLPIKAIKQ